MSGSLRRLGLLVPLLAAGCVLSEPEVDWGLQLINRSDRNILVRLGYREPDAGRVERIVLVRSRSVGTLAVINVSWEALVRRVGSLTIDFCDEEKRETLEQIVVTEGDLRSADWTILYPRP